MIEQLRSVTRDPRYRIDQDLLDGGFDLLKLLEIVQVISGFLGRDLSINELWEARTVSTLLSQVDTGLCGATSLATGTSTATRWLAAPQQRRFYAVHQPAVGTCDQNVCCEFELPSSGVRLGAFVQGLVDKYDALRVTFYTSGGQLYQIAATSSAVAIEENDLTTYGEDWRAAYDRIRQTEAARRFDLRTWPLFHCRLVRTPSRTVFLFTAYHIVFDGLSRPVLEHELQLHAGLAHKADAAAAGPVAFNYCDYANWANQRLAGPGHARSRQYWSEVFDGQFQPFHLQANGEDVDPAANGYLFRFGSDGRRMVEMAAAAHRTTVFTVLLSVFISFLCATLFDDVTIAVSASGRDHPQVGRLIGMFANILLVRAQRAEAAAFGSLVRLVHGRFLEAQAHQQFQYDEIARLLDLAFIPDRLPITGIYFNAMTETVRALPADLETGIHYDTGARMISELELRYRQVDDDLLFKAVYRRSAFSQTGIEAFCRAFRSAAYRQLAGGPESPAMR